MKLKWKPFYLGVGIGLIIMTGVALAKGQPSKKPANQQETAQPALASEEEKSFKEANGGLIKQTLTKINPSPTPTKAAVHANKSEDNQIAKSNKADSADVQTATSAPTATTAPLPTATPTTSPQIPTATNTPITTVSSPTPTATLTSSPTPTNGPETNTINISLHPVSSSCANGYANFDVRVIKWPNNYWDFYFTGEAKNLKPLTDYQLWICVTGSCGSHQTAIQRTNEMGLFRYDSQVINSRNDVQSFVIIEAGQNVLIDEACLKTTSFRL